MRPAAHCRYGPRPRRNSFTGLVELNRCVQGGQSVQCGRQRSTNDAWLSQTADEAEGHTDSRPWGTGGRHHSYGRM